MKSFFHKYPQNIWANAIISLFKNGTVKADPFSCLYDAPCGNGIIGNLVFKGLKNKKMIMLDNDERLLQSPYIQIDDPNFKYTVGDIFAYEPEGTDNVWLLINSLYCLPDTEKLLVSKKIFFKFIIGIFPDIESSNFTYFRKKNPEFKNPSLMDKDQTIAFFLKVGYKPVFSKRICKMPFHKWNYWFDKLKIHPLLKNTILTCLDKILFFLPGHYTIIAFIRYE